MPRVRPCTRKEWDANRFGVQQKAIQATARLAEARMMHDDLKLRHVGWIPCAGARVERAWEPDESAGVALIDFGLVANLNTDDDVERAQKVMAQAMREFANDE